MPNLNQTDREIMRNAVLGYLAQRAQLSFCSEAIARALNARALIDFTAHADDVQTACVFLAGLGYAAVRPAELGATQHWQITSTGVLHAERNGLA